MTMMILRSLNRSTKKHYFFSLFVTLLFLCGQPVAFALSLTPMYLNLKPNGTQSRSVVTFSNTSPRPMPVTTRISELILGPNGEQQTVPSTGSFLIFPPQAVIAPHSKQTFRVQWRGQPALAKGKTYYLTVSQVLAEDSRDQSEEGVRLTAKVGIGFSAIMTMQAAQGVPAPTVKSSRILSNSKAKPILETIVANQSNQNFLMVQADSTVSVFGSKNNRLWSHTYTPDQMMRNFGLGIVQPNKNRRMRIPLPNLPEHIARQAKSVKLEIRPSAK